MLLSFRKRTVLFHCWHHLVKYGPFRFDTALRQLTAIGEISEVREPICRTSARRQKRAAQLKPLLAALGADAL